jgi:branched-chain amino acid transport system substrate-binding protein
MLVLVPLGARADILIAGVDPMSVTPMTGQYAVFGEQLARGTEMAVRDVNAQGGVGGQRLTLRIVDDACDPKLAVEIAEEIARQGVVLVVGHACSGASIPASRVYHEKGILMITPASINSRLTEQGFANVFRTCGRDDVQGIFAADYVLDNKLAERIAIIQDQSVFGKGMADEFRKQLNRRGVREAMYEAISQDDNDFSPLIARMRDVGIQLVYFGGYSTEAGLFVRQARGQGLGATMMANSAMVNQEPRTAAALDLEGQAPRGCRRGLNAEAVRQRLRLSPDGKDGEKVAIGRRLKRRAEAGGRDRPRLEPRWRRPGL